MRFGSSRAFMIVKAIVVLTALGALACSASVTPRRVVGVDGTEWWAIKCNNDLGSCLAQAKQRCPSGYDVQGEHEPRGDDNAAGPAGASFPMVPTQMAPGFT